MSLRRLQTDDEILSWKASDRKRFGLVCGFRATTTQSEQQSEKCQPTTTTTTNMKLTTTTLDLYALAADDIPMQQTKQFQ
ncbi:hypothetical protein IV203_011313 [Nitzschia inconspicua]|uniref:Uncharacterized protein n=1 Tax=Nitzschia inconspicua TaxID=303405 RepID=A0A9K3PJ68_9STRA|nr:hypothetical protein IV203_011313 [Nitzschia inconspicua]